MFLFSSAGSSTDDGIMILWIVREKATKASTQKKT